MKLKTLAYKSVREKFDGFNGELSNALDKSIIDADDILIDQGIAEFKYTTKPSFIYNKIPIGTVSEIDGADHHGETYKIEFDFHANSIVNATYFLMVCSDRFQPKKVTAFSELEAQAKFAIYVKEISAVKRLLFKAFRSGTGDGRWYDGTDWSATTETHTGDTIVEDLWYNIIIERKKDRYRIFVRNMDKTEVEEADDLTFTDFTGIYDLRFSNGDLQDRETADYIIIGLLSDPGSTIRIKISDLFMSPPIEHLEHDLIEVSELNLETQDSFSNSRLLLSNAQTNEMIIQKKLALLDDKIEEGDEVMIFEDYEQDEI